MFDFRNLSHHALPSQTWLADHSMSKCDESDSYRDRELEMVYTTLVQLVESHEIWILIQHKEKDDMCPKKAVHRQLML